MLGIELGDTQELCVSDWQPSWHQSPLFTTQVRDPRGREPLGEVRTVDGSDLGLKQRLGANEERLALVSPGSEQSVHYHCYPHNYKGPRAVYKTKCSLFMFIQQNICFSAACICICFHLMRQDSIRAVQW